MDEKYRKPFSITTDVMKHEHINFEYQKTLRQWHVAVVEYLGTWHIFVMSPSVEGVRKAESREQAIAEAEHLLHTLAKSQLKGITSLDADPDQTTKH